MNDLYQEVTPRIVDPGLKPTHVSQATPGAVTAAPSRGLFTSVSENKVIVIVLVIVIVAIIVIVFIVRYFTTSETQAKPLPPMSQPPQAVQAPQQPPPATLQAPQAPPQPSPEPTQAPPPARQATREELINMLRKSKSMDAPDVPQKTQDELAHMMSEAAAAHEEPVEPTIDNIADEPDDDQCTETTAGGRRCKNKPKIGGKCQKHM